MGLLAKETIPRIAVRLGSCALLALAFGGGIAGCGTGGSSRTTNEVASQTAQEAFAASRAAASKADNVTIRGTSSFGRLAKSSIDLKLTRDGGRGTVNLLGTELQLIRSGDALYVKGRAEVYSRLHIKQPATPDTWVKLPLSGSQLAGLTDLSEETARVLSTAGGITKGSVTTIDGQPALELRTTGKLYKGRLFVKTEGEPYPLKLEKRGRETSTFTFTDWNRTSAAAVPAKVMSSGG